MGCFHSKGETQGISYKIWRNNPKTGFYEEIIYHGNIKQIPKGWSVVR